ncbi:MAG: glycoside hydrolase family 15 protein [Candidatus Jacksonbacteria bacterium]|nr:glycoside hydrolase family 15 protein [Candidatus Jacksonbacteria bacterium]
MRNGRFELPIQEDGTALVLCALWKHYELSRDLEFIESVYNSLIKRAADFMAEYRNEATGLPKPSYDLWEEKFGVHTFTASAVYGALVCAAKFAALLGKDEHSREYQKIADRMREGITAHLYNKERRYFYRTISFDDGKVVGRDETIDASGVYGVVNFGVFAANDPLISEALGTIEEKLYCRTHVGGVPRYEGDKYYRIAPDAPPNPWFITTLWLAQLYIASSVHERDLDRGKQWLNWSARHALGTGILSEQIHPYSGKQLSAAPLTWSHSEFVITVIKYLEKLEEMGLCDKCTMR